MTAVVIAAEAGPVHCSPDSSEITECAVAAVDSNSAARLLQAEAADISGAEPAPLYIHAETISGGSAPKSKGIFVHPVLVGGRVARQRSVWA